MLAATVLALGRKFPLDVLNLSVAADVIEFQSNEAFSSFGLIKVK
jgi:hypothetical protein